MKPNEALFLGFLVVKGLTSILATSCHSDWKDTPYGCFFPFQFSKDYADAKEYCKDKGAHLITALRNIASHNRNNFFRNLLDVQSTECFIGLRKNSDGWYWEDGVKAGATLAEKLSSDAKGPCAKIGAYDQFEISAVSCANYYKFICENITNVSSTVALKNSVQSHAAMSLVSTSLPIFPVSTNVPAVYSTSSLKPTSISSNPYRGYTSSASYSKVIQNTTKTAWSKDISLSIHPSFPSSTTVHVTTQTSHNTLPTPYHLPASSLLTPGLSSKPSSSTVYTFRVTSTSCSEAAFNLSSTLYTCNREEITATGRTDSNTLTEEMSATSVIHITPSISVDLVPPNDTLHEKVTKYMKQIEDLDSSLPTSAKFATEMTTNLLQSFTTSDKPSGQPMMAVDTFEEFLYQYGKQHLNYTSREIHWNTTSMAVQILRIYEPSNDIQLHSPNNDVLVYFPQVNLENGTILVQVLYDDLHVILPSLFGGNAGRLRIGSRITSILQVHPSNQTTLKRNVNISFKNFKGVQGSGTLVDSRKCVFWLFPPRDSGQKDGEWSDEGCTLLHSSDDHTVCSCNHLTSFAVLMQTNGKNKVSSFDHDILSLLTIVGLGLSLFGSTITFVAYMTLTDRESHQTQIRLNLVASLWMAHFLFVTGIRATNSQVICVMIGALLQLFFLASLCWMLVEGIQLYYRIVRVYNAEMTIKGCYLFAWGFPVLVVCVSLIISSFGAKGIIGFIQEEICWVSNYLYLAWVFAVPVSLILLANLVFFLRVMKEISKMEIRQPKQQRVSVVRRNLKACFLLFPLLGITWFTGCFIMFHPDIILIYMFTILNSTQGFFIFLFHCVGNREIRSAFKKKIYPNNISKTEKRNEPIPLAIASVSNMFCDDLDPHDIKNVKNKTLPPDHIPNYRSGCWN